ncbi:MAG: metallopeptidase family protein [Trueperaceae bacterium]|nr:metallopeptidase family protein [Trueperaceae bacterium]
MTYRQFRESVADMVDEIPEVFMTDLQGVHALREAKREEGYQDVWRMGEYLDPGPDDLLGGNDGLGRHVALYWGSFRRIAENDPDFDWEEEIWETLTHELQHHVESLAGDGRLIDQDLLDARAFAEADAEDEAGRDEAEAAEDEGETVGGDEDVADTDGWRDDEARRGGEDRHGGVAGLLRRLFGRG